MRKINHTYFHILVVSVLMLLVGCGGNISVKQHFNKYSEWPNKHTYIVTEVTSLTNEAPAEFLSLLKERANEKLLARHILGGDSYSSANLTLVVNNYHKRGILACNLIPGWIDPDKVSMTLIVKSPNDKSVLGEAEFSYWTALGSCDEGGLATQLAWRVADYLNNANAGLKGSEN